MVWSASILSILLIKEVVTMSEKHESNAITKLKIISNDKTVDDETKETLQKMHNFIFFKDYGEVEKKFSILIDWKTDDKFDVKQLRQDAIMFEKSLIEGPIELSWDDDRKEVSYLQGLLSLCIGIDEWMSVVV